MRGGINQYISSISFLPLQTERLTFTEKFQTVLVLHLRFSPIAGGIIKLGKNREILLLVRDACHTLLLPNFLCMKVNCSIEEKCKILCLSVHLVHDTVIVAF